MAELKIRQKCEDMIVYAHIALRQFPKSERFTLAADIKRSMYRVLQLVIVANQRKDKRPTLYELDVELDVLRSLVRVSMQLGFLPFKKYEVWSGLLAEIGRMLGGWLKTAGPKTQGLG